MKINNLDTFYTPPELAEDLLSYVDCERVKKAVDFCVGKGELLKAAQAKFGNIKCYGTDIDNMIVDEIKESNPTWNIAVCDFTNKQSRENTSILKKATFDLVLLNPPFTCKGSKINKVEFCDCVFHVSTAMTFLVESLRYLSKGGSLYAIMPASVVYSAKDKKLVTAISEKYEIELLEEREKQLFKNCAPNIVLLKVKTKSTSIKSNSIIALDSVPILFDAKEYNISIFRGNLSVHEAVKYKNSKGLMYVHSTNLRNNTIVLTKMTVSKAQSIINGPAILLHRVGKPDITKVCIVDDVDYYVLSDCVIAILGNNKETIQSLYDTIISKKDIFYSLYKGTGAKYITIERLKEALNLY
ncbi:MAG: SAM-dependent methyltransferase [Tannerella sp.]|jgi:tRNA1(Val) A37 N6-methylase TrmN6|nr:SAM-dependent methyltransferase [Tannerella sp.]